ncbi:MAG: AAA family ATPase [Leucobacter sp.]
MGDRIGQLANSAVSPSSAGGWIRRQALIDRIDEAAGVVVVRGESGSGKTTLVSQWAEETCAATVAWVSFDSHDGHPALAWRKVLVALSASAGDPFRQIFEDYSEDLLRPTDIPGVLLAVFRGMRSPFVFVFDDVHLTGEEFQEQIRGLCQVLPAVSLVCTTRSRTVFEEDRALVAAGLTVIDSIELAFGIDETTALVAAVLEGPSESLPSRIQRATQGHVLATRLAVSRILRDQPTHASRADLAELLRTAGDALPPFASEVEERVAFSISLCPESTEELADRLFQSSDDAWGVIERFEHAGFGRFEMKSGRLTFRFHALVKAALLECAEERLGAEEVLRIRCAAFELLDGVSDLVDVFELGLDAELDRPLFGFFTRNFSELSLVRSRECVALLERLPRVRLHRDWPLPLMLAVMLAESRSTVPGLANDMVRIALRRLWALPATGSSEQQAIIAIARFASYRIARDYETAAEHVDKCVREISSFMPLERAAATTEWAPTLVQGLITRQLAGDLEGAIEIGNAMRDQPHRGRRLHVHSHMSFMQAFDGDLRLARHHLAEIDAARTAPGWERSILSLGWRLGSALIAGEEGRVDEAIESLEPVVANLDGHELWPAVLWVRSRLRLASGEVGLGFLEFEADLEATELLPISDWWRERLRVNLAELALADGNMLEARGLLAGLSDAGDVQVVRASFELANGRTKAAGDLIDPLLDRGTLGPREHISAELIAAVVEYQIGSIYVARARAVAALQNVRLYRNRLPLMVLSTSIIDDIRTLVPEKLWVNPLATPFIYPVDSVELTERESFILQQLGSRGTLEDIATQMFISSNTMKTHLKNLYKKLGVSGRSAAVEEAERRGLVVIPQRLTRPREHR